MKRPQLTLSLLLGLVGWGLSALPAPRASAAADAREMIAARNCGWLDIEAGSEETPHALADFEGTPEGVNRLRFRVVTESPNAPPAAPRSAATVPTEDPLLEWRRVPDAAVERILWIVPMPSRWAQRRTAETAARLALAVSGDIGGAALLERELGGLRIAAGAASNPLAVGDRCPIVARHAIAPPVAAKVSGPRPADAFRSAAQVSRGLAAMLQQLAAGLERLEREMGQPE